MQVIDHMGATGSQKPSVPYIIMEFYPHQSFFWGASGNFSSSYRPFAAEMVESTVCFTEKRITYRLSASLLDKHLGEC